MNIASELTIATLNNPTKRSVVLAKSGKFITFNKLETLSNRYANGLTQNGIKRGERVLIFLKPSLKFHALVFAVFKIGAIPVFIDPGMGMKNLLNAISEVSPQCLIAEPIVHLFSYIFGEKFSSIKIKISSKKWTIGSDAFLDEFNNCEENFSTIQMDPNEMGAILFTSGGTGRPKGVVYTHKIFSEQMRLLKKTFNLTENDVDLPGFPLFSLFTLCMGMTSCIPDMNPSKPSKANPKKLFKNIQENGVTFVAGSPAIWERLADYCNKRGLKLLTVKYVAMFGAPVRSELHEKFKNLLPNGTTYTPYGATESLPVSNISGDFILKETAKLTGMGRGTCIGKSVEGIEVAIIPITEEKIDELSSIKILPIGEIGEIIVRGEVVTKSYYQAENETQKAKIKDGETFWHRMGDLGYLDENKNLWFCGRKSHRAETQNGLMCSVTVEAIFNKHLGVRRSALAVFGKLGEQTTAIVIERNSLGKKMNKELLVNELNQIAKSNLLTKEISKVYFCDHFPVDVRHNIKIDRNRLSNEIVSGVLQ